jgi:hypothetical protein
VKTQEKRIEIIIVWTKHQSIIHSKQGSNVAALDIFASKFGMLFRSWTILKVITAETLTFTFFESVDWLIVKHFCGWESRSFGRVVVVASGWLCSQGFFRSHVLLAQTHFKVEINSGLELYLNSL